MDLTLNETRMLAAGAHAALGQRYDDGPYTGHLDAVVAVLREFKFNTRDIAAIALLHDLFEDTQVTADDLTALGVDRHVIRSVTFVTDEEGHNRKTRKARTYERVAREIRDFSHEDWVRDGVIVKLADRIANLRSARLSNPRLLKMYLREATDLRETDAFRAAYILPEYVYNADPRWERILAEYDRQVRP
jgi:(p)ppGpp synthase/HD superfamily hydrolase